MASSLERKVTLLPSKYHSVLHPLRELNRKETQEFNKCLVMSKHHFLAMEKRSTKSNNVPGSVMELVQKNTTTTGSFIKKVSVSWDILVDGNTSSLTGDDVMRRINFVLNEFPKYIPDIHRAEHQIQFHNEVLHALIPRIYRSEWASQSTSILKRYSITKCYPEILLCTPRRFGKTTAVVLLIVALIYSIPKVTIAIFSTAKRTSGKLKTAVNALLDRLPHIDKLRDVNNAEQTSLKFNAMDTREISCYPVSSSVCKSIIN